MSLSPQLSRVQSRRAQRRPSEAQTAVEESERMFAEMIHSIERRRSEVTELIGAQEKSEVSRAKGLLKRRELIAELKRTDAERKQLSLTQDPVHFLKNMVSITGRPYSSISTSVTHNKSFYLEPLKKSVSALKTQPEEKLSVFKPEIVKISAAAVKNIQIIKSIQLSDGQALITEPVTREDFLQYSSHFTLEPNTGHIFLHLSDGNRRVEKRPKAQSYLDHPDRFHWWEQVLCREGVSARCYWEVEWSGEWVGIAVSYKSISRKGGGLECVFGRNDQSWRLLLTSSSSSFWHNNEETKLHPVASSTIGVYVDHRAGTLAFYSISDTMTLLHRVHTTFTHPLYPGFGICSSGPSSVKLL